MPDAELLVDAHLRARNAAGLTLGLRGRTSSGGGLVPGTQSEDAAYAKRPRAAARRDVLGRLAVARQVYPRLAYDAELARGFTLHAALAELTALVPAPGDPGDIARV